MDTNSNIRKPRTTYNSMSEWISYPLNSNIFSRYKQQEMPSVFTLQNQVNFNRPSHLIKNRKLKYSLGEEWREYDIQGESNYTCRTNNDSFLESSRQHNYKQNLENKTTNSHLSPRNYYLGYLKRLREVEDPALVDDTKFRSGNGGSTWRHANCYLKPDGKRYYFIDGFVRENDHLDH